MTPRRPLKRIHVVGAAVLEGERCLATQRSALMSNPNMWEFPGGKVEAGETPQAALRRELHEELGIDVEVGSFLARGEASIPGSDVRIVLDVYVATWRGGDIELVEHAAWGWFHADALRQLDWAEADLPALARLLDALDAKRV